MVRQDVYLSPDGALRVRYHTTDIVVVDSTGLITLNSDGWRTATTKRRMNQTANQCNLGFQVVQHKGEWFVQFYKDGRVYRTMRFQDGMTFRRQS